MHLNDKLLAIAHLIYDQSLYLERDDLVLLEGMDVEQSTLLAFAAIGRQKGYEVYILNKSLDVNNFNNSASALLGELANFELALMKRAKALIGLRNVVDAKIRLDKEQKSMVLDSYLKPVHYDYRNKHLQWIYFRLPNEYFSTQVGVEYSVFQDYYYKCVLLNYNALNEQQKALSKYLNHTKKVKITGNNTSLIFDLIEDGVFNATGYHNLPDGEVFTSPLKYSVNGHIQFNVPTTYYGVKFDKIWLKFDHGKVVDAKSNQHNSELMTFLNQDEGSSYIGEFAIGTNPFIDKPINDILFDEKMWGTLHIALGNAYQEADNGNRSAIHWDLILDQRLPFGGELYFDDQLIRKNGLFVTSELVHLNPEILKNKIRYE
ncbi:aminopeptidase [Fulvivirga lutimaris]|uniref:aminopeptidase n=1 Tax=Fulvivirga lutimaris TaxID=1819566 RepID=UPI0012BCA4ED|nr:aminopeptidase [Fulvivirga lutimaris]MTI38303.1 hypothetical protein [Fulvivirga lutimaris]